MIKFSALDNFVKTIERDNFLKHEAALPLSPGQTEQNADIVGKFVGDGVAEIEETLEDCKAAREDETGAIDRNESCVLFEDELNMIELTALSRFSPESLEEKFPGFSSDPEISKMIKMKYGFALEHLSHFLESFNQMRQTGQPDPENPEISKLFPEKDIELLIDALYRADPTDASPVIDGPQDMIERMRNDDRYTDKQKFDSYKERMNNVLRPDSFADMEQTFFNFTENTLKDNETVVSLLGTFLGKGRNRVNQEQIVEVALNAISGQDPSQQNEVKTLMNFILVKANVIAGDLLRSKKISSPKDILGARVSAASYSDFFNALEHLAAGRTLIGQETGIPAINMKSLFLSFTGIEREKFIIKKEEIENRDPLVGLMSEMRDVIDDMEQLNIVVNESELWLAEGDETKIKLSGLDEERKSFILDFAIKAKEESEYLYLASDPTEKDDHVGNYAGKEDQILRGFKNFLNKINESYDFVSSYILKRTENGEKSLIDLQNLNTWADQALEAFGQGNSALMYKLIKKMFSLMKEMTRSKSGAFYFKIPRKKLGISGTIFFDPTREVQIGFTESVQNLKEAYNNMGLGLSPNKKDEFIKFSYIAEEATGKLAPLTTTKTEQQLLEKGEDSYNYGEDDYNYYEEQENADEIQEEFAKDFPKTQASVLLMRINKSLGMIQAMALGEENLDNYNWEENDALNIAENKKTIRRISNTKPSQGITEVI